MSKGIIKTIDDMIPAPTQTITTSPQATPIYPISKLINSVYFFLDDVLVIDEKNVYRLIVYSHGEILVDKRFKTIRGARIAFFRLFKHKAWGPETKAQWSHFYDPDEDWMEDLMKIVTGRNYHG